MGHAALRQRLHLRGDQLHCVWRTDTRWATDAAEWVDVLVSHGAVIATLTPAEYVQQQSYYIRLFTGHPLIFYLAPALYFRFIAAR